MRNKKSSHKGRSAKTPRLKLTRKPKSKPKVAKKLKLSVPRSAVQYSAMSADAQERWNRVTHVVAKMRTDGTSLTKAAKEFNLKPVEVIDLAKSALRKQKNGRYVAKKSDRLLRVLVIPSPEGLKEVSVRSSETASKIAQYSDAVQKYLRTGETSTLSKFKRLRIKDSSGKPIKLLLDRAELNRLGSAGVLSFESLYARTA